jgi:hypothetical protein
MVVGRMLMLMGPVLPLVLMFMHMGIPGMSMLMGMFVQVLMFMDMLMLVEVGFPTMLMFMAMYVGVIMRMQMFVFVFAFHDVLLYWVSLTNMAAGPSKKAGLERHSKANTLPAPPSTEVCG